MITLIFLRVWHLNIARRFPNAPDGWKHKAGEIYIYW